ncbi:MAG TPA: ASCH domain-containing protein [Allosphingosinicella sp.]|nr:ASCH domain-containing protein [Allosphingosinicella sp.]
MMFAKKLRDRVRSGEITISIRIWQSPRVRAGGRYPLPPGHVVIDSIREIALADVTGEMARASGFDGLVDLLRTAKHGKGTNVYFITFHYADE